MLFIGLPFKSNYCKIINYFFVFSVSLLSHLQCTPEVGISNRTPKYETCTSYWLYDSDYVLPRMENCSYFFNTYFRAFSPARLTRGQNQAQTIRPSKLSCRQWFLCHFEGTPQQEK
jgi:hypothetical protein